MKRMAWLKALNSYKIKCIVYTYVSILYLMFFVDYLINYLFWSVT